MQGGCIIRAVFLDDIYQAYKRNPALENLMMDEEFGSKLVNSEKAWRSVVIKVTRLVAAISLHAPFTANSIYPQSCNPQLGSGGFSLDRDNALKSSAATL